jgi:hypothetical protein
LSAGNRTDSTAATICTPDHGRDERLTENGGRVIEEMLA